jgi:flavin reductase (DIM6/NTAB) family NADH-FMN oxidoreductase RutF
LDTRAKAESRDKANSSTFVEAMGAAATGVTVVTTAGTAGRFGITVSAIASVSAEPPLLLVCVNRKNPSVAAITGNGYFAVNILADHQIDVARIFAGRPPEGQPYEFVDGHWRIGHSKLPLLIEAAASFECEIETIHDAGTHRIFIGRVIAANRGTHAALIYNNRSYARAVALNGAPK